MAVPETDLARLALGGEGTPLYARNLGYQQIGALVGLQTPAAIYIGTLWGLSIFENKIYISLKRDGAEAKATVEPDHLVLVAAPNHTNGSER